MEPSVKEFATQLLKTQITDNLTLGERENKLNHQTGLICFIQGYCLETGFQVQPNLELAITHYLYGLKYFADPLCALQLEQYYTKQKKKISAALYLLNFIKSCKCIYYVLLELAYDLRHTVYKIEYEKYYQGLMEIAPQPELPLHQLTEFLKALYLFREQGQQQHYDQLLHTFEEMGARIHAYPFIIKQFLIQTTNPDKAPDRLFQLCKVVNPEPYLQQCLYNISLHGMIENCHMNNIRSIIFEMSFLHRPDPYPKVIEQLYLRQTHTVLHRILLIRKHAKVQKSFEIQLEELKFIDQSKTPITYYLCGKRKQINNIQDCYLCKAKQLLNNPWPDDKYVRFVYLFYKAKLELHHQNHQGYVSLLDDRLFDECKNFYDMHQQWFKQVRTLQFYSLRCRIDKQRDKIAYKNKQIQQYFDQQKIEALLKSKSRFQNMQRSSNDLMKSQIYSPVKSPNKVIIQTQSIWVEDNFRLQQIPSRTIQGPQMTFQSENPSLLSQSRFIDLENKIRYSKLNLIPTHMINDIQFLGKSNRDGQLCIGQYQGQLVFIKTLAFLNYEQINQYFKVMKKYFNLEHINLRGVIGFNIEDLQQSDLNGIISIVTYKYDYNLRTFLKQHHLTTQQKWHMAIQIIDAVYYLHQHQIMFCNLHPNNILIERDNHIPILIDFDLQFDKDYLNNKYMPKEILEEEMPLLTEKVDIYSLGCVLLFLFFGCEFSFQTIYNNTTLSLEVFKTINPYESKNVDFLLPPSTELLEERARTLILKCLNGQIELLDLLQHFYDNA